MDKKNSSAVVVALMAIAVFAILVVTQIPSGVEGEVTLIEYVDDVDESQLSGLDDNLDAVTGDIKYLPIGAEPKGDAPEEPDLSTIKPGSYQSRTNKRYGCFKKCFCSGSTCRCTPGGCFRTHE